MTEVRKGGNPANNGCDCVYCRMSRAMRETDKTRDVALAIGRLFGSLLAQYEPADRAAVVRFVCETAGAEVSRIEIEEEKHPAPVQPASAVH